MSRENYIISINGSPKERVDLEHLMGAVHNYADEHVTENSGLTVIQVWHADAPEEDKLPEFPFDEQLTQFEYMELTLAELTDPTTAALNMARLNELGADGWELLATTPNCLFKRPRDRPPDVLETASKSNDELRAEVMELADDIQADVHHGECFYEIDMLNMFCGNLDKLKTAAWAYHASNADDA